MKKQFIAFLIFLSTFVNLSLAQQITTMSERELTPSQLFSMHQGQYESFKSIVIRFEVACQEMDAQSMSDLKELLGKMASEYNATPYPTSETEGKLLERAQQKATIWQTLNKLPLSAEDKALGPKAEQLMQQLNQYLRLMEADILEHQKALGQ
jgi:hypothetical protein